MPLLAWATDLHLDHADAAERRRFLEAVRQADVEAFVLTGDLSVATDLVEDLRTLAATTDRPIYFVLGNHDHYGGSIAGVRDALLDLAATIPQLQWLPPAGVISLGADTALIGVDGWADGRHGNPLATPFVLNDDRLIAELAALPERLGKLAVKRALADADAARLQVLLDRAVTTANRIVVATHVPPFVESLPRSGRLHDPRWQPLLTCGATGRVLTAFARTHPDIRVTVLAGHTHAATETTLLPNLDCRVGGARYGAPTVSLVDTAAPTA